MPILRSEITTNLATDVIRDYATNTVYHQNDAAGGLLPVDYQNHANQIKDLFSGHDPVYTTFQLYKQRHIKVVVYNMSDPVPRPEQAVALYTPTTYDTALGMFPRQVAIRCSWYCSRNLKGKRGGIYIGPCSGAVGGGGDRIDVATRGQIIALGHGLFDIGGINVYHVLMKSMPNDAVGPAQAVTDYWCDDSFDTIRRRKITPTTRTVLHP